MGRTLNKVLWLGAIGLGGYIVWKRWGPDIVAKFKAIFGAPPVREAYEVSVQA